MGSGAGSSTDAAPSRHEEEAKDGVGTVVAVLDATGSQDAAKRLCQEARVYILVSAFSFDRADLADALVDARRRGVEVRVAVDKKMSLGGTTRDQMQVLKAMAANGVKVRVCQGRGYSEEYQAVGRRPIGGLGAQHSKTLLTEKGAVVGSTNWTTASRANVEVGLEVVLRKAEQEKLRMRLLEAFEAGTELFEAEVAAVQKSRSASPVRRRRA